MPGGGEDCVDGIAVGACQVVSFEQAIVFEVADDRFDGVSPSHLAADGGRCDASGVAEDDIEAFAGNLMALWPR